MNRLQLVSELAYQPSFKRLATSYLACPADREEALQNTAIIALEKLPLDHPHPAGWYGLTLKRECLQILRKAKRENVSEPPPEQYEPDLDSPLDVYCGLSRMKPAEQIALISLAAGHSYREIQDAHDWTYTKVNRLLAEGRNRLRDLVA